MNMETNYSNEQLMQLAIGRILRMASRPAEPGDVAEYERCREIFMDAAAEQGIVAKETSIGYCRPGWNFGNSILD